MNLLPNNAAGAEQLVVILGNTHLLYILPQLVLSAGALLTMLAAAFSKDDKGQNITYLLATLFNVAGVAASVYLAMLPAGKAFNGMVSSDLFSGILNVIYSSCALLICLAAHSYFRTRGRYTTEVYSLIQFAVVGMMFMTMASDLIIVFIGLEILSVSLYVLAGIDNKDPRSNEAAVKYFLMGAFSSAFLLYGIALLYGACGSTALKDISIYIFDKSAWGNTYVQAGIIMILIGFGFKISMVPFHMWTPDVYQGAPLLITAFMSTAPKAAALSALVKIVLAISPLDASAGWLSGLIAVLAIMTMTVGNLMALNQVDIKRIMAFSSIAHIGYLLIAFAVMNRDAVAAILFYFCAYVLMNIGFFTVLSLLARNEDRNLTLEGIQGVAKEKPLLGLFLVIFLFSLAGIPPTAGFAAKFFIFSAAIEAKLYFLAIIGILNSAISAYYYLRIILYSFIKDAEGDNAAQWQAIRINIACLLVLIVSGVAVLEIGIVPRNLIELGKKAILFLG